MEIDGGSAGGGNSGDGALSDSEFRLKIKTLDNKAFDFNIKKDVRI